MRDFSFYLFFGDMKIIFHAVSLFVNTIMLNYNLSYQFCICLASIDLQVLSSAQFQRSVRQRTDLVSNPA